MGEQKEGKGSNTGANRPQELTEVYRMYEKQSLERARGRGANKLGVTNAQIRDAIRQLMQGREKLVLAAVVRAIGEHYHVQKERMGQLRIRVVGALDTKDQEFVQVKEDGVVYIKRRE